METVIATLTGLAPVTLYPTLFVGVVFLGGLVLIPAITLTLVGSISLPALFFITVIGGILSDSFWYKLGKISKKERLYSLPFIKKRMEEAEHFSSFYQKHGVRLVYITKFVYGTRVASHVLAGMHKLNYFKFLFSTALGTSTWFWILYYLTKTLNTGVDGTQTLATRIQMIFLIMFSILIFFNWFTGTYVRRKLLKKK